MCRLHAPPLPSAVMERPATAPVCAVAVVVRSGASSDASAVAVAVPARITERRTGEAPVPQDGNDSAELKPGRSERRDNDPRARRP